MQDFFLLRYIYSPATQWTFKIRLVSLVAEALEVESLLHVQLDARMEGRARVGHYLVAAGAKQLVDRHARRLALGIPQGDVHRRPRRHRQGRPPARGAPPRPPPPR